MVAGFAARNPDAPALLPAVVAASHGYVPPGSERVAEPIQRTDARLAVAQQIAGLADTPPPADGAGPHDPTRARDTAGALFKLAAGFKPEQLTATEQARLKARRDEPALVRKAPDGATILTDAGRKVLTDAAPAAKSFVPTTEAEDLRRLSQPASQPEVVDSTPSRSAQPEPSAPANTPLPGWESFPTESETLGIPRDRMPQIRSEHRGALANFLEKRGIGWSNEDVQPAALKPSQAEYSPEKVERARAHDGPERRILVSNDGYVIDGHHQWVRTLQDDPHTPLPVVRLDAPARDILAQIHEFPSADMDGPAVEPQRQPATEQGRNAKKGLARLEELEAQAQQQGRELSPGQQATRTKLERIVADDLTAQQAAVQRNATRARERSIHDALDRNQPVDAAAADEAGLVLPAHYRRSIDGAAYEPDGQPAPFSAKGQNVARNLDTLRAMQRRGETLNASQLNAAGHFRRIFHEERARSTAAPTRDSEPVADARRWLSEQRAAGRNPTLRELIADRDLSAPEGQRIINEQRAAEQPATPVAAAEVQRARRTVDELTARRQRNNGFLDVSDRQALANAHGIVERDLNRRTLGSNPQPTTDAGRHAQARNRFLQDALDSGAHLDAGTHAEFVRNRQILESDFSAQRRVLEARQSPAGTGGPITNAEALKTASAGLQAHRALLASLGVEQAGFGRTRAGSGIEFSENGTLIIDPAKLARSLTTVRDNQRKLGIDSTPEDYFAQVLAHEGIHAADVAVARAKGQSLEQRYAGLPWEAMPAGLRDAARQAYGATNYDALPDYAQKAEAVRAVVEGKYTGRITEQLYKFIAEAVDFLKRAAGFEGADPRFRAHVEEVERRIEAAQEAAAPAKRPRSFQMPASRGEPDVLDHIRTEGGIVSQRQASQKPSFSKFQGDYDGAPTLGGYYWHAVHGNGRMMPDQMAETLHQNYGIGDGSVDGMWNAVSQARDLRSKVTARQKETAAAEAQAGRFDRDAVATDTAKGKTEINTGSLNVGDHVTIGNQRLKVVDVDPDTLDVTLEDHSKYGVQTLADNTALYVEKVEPGRGGATLAAARPEEYRTATVEERKALGIPPAWTDVQVARDPNARRVAVGKDAKGRIQSRYSAAHVAQAQADKFARGRAFDEALPGIMERVHGSIASGDGREEAAVLRLIQRSAFRNGGDEDTGAKVKAYGASNLRAEHVAFDGHTTHFDFTGKLGVRQQHSIEHPEMTADLRARASKGGALFDTNDAKVRDYLKGVGGDFKVHDFRTWNATDLARREVVAADQPTAADGFWSERERIGDLVAKKLGDTRKVVLESYIDPAVFEPWKTALKITDDSRPTRARARAAASDPVGATDGRTDARDAGLLRDEQLRGGSDARGAGAGQAEPGSGDRGAGRLAAAEPEPFDPDAVLPPDTKASPAAKAGALAWVRQQFADLKQAAAVRAEHQGKVADLRAGHYAADTRAADTGLKAGTSIALDIPDALDRQAAGPVVEAGGRRSQLTEDLAKVQASPDRKLAEKYAPIYQRALDHLDRLQAAAEGWRTMRTAEDAAAEKAGLPPSWQKRMQAIYDDPLSPEATIVPDQGFGTTKGYKTAADAIAAGVDPKSTDLADFVRRYVERNRQAVNQADFLRDASAIRSRDGKPLLAPIEGGASTLNPDGSITSTARTPKGYEAVQAGANTLAVNAEFAPIFKAMYGESAVRANKATNALLKTAAFAKKNTLVFETYHGFRLGASAGLGYGMIDYRDGAAAAKYRLEDLGRAVKAGALTDAQAKSVRESYEVDDKLLRAGLPVGKYADLMTEQSHGLLDHVPVIGPAAAGFNRWMFGELQRGYIRQAGRIAYERNQERFPELSEKEVLRHSVKEVADFFGDPAHTSFLASKTAQDIANIIGFSPRWTEGKLKSELTGLVQMAKIPVDLVRGKGLRAGNVAQAMGTLLLGSVVGTQVLNLFTRGKLTFQNPEEDHKFDAWLPGGPHGKGFWFSPLSIGAEFTHGLHKYMGQGDNALDATARIAGNKLSAPARGVKDLLTGEDWRGQPYGSLGERVKAAALDTLPSPLPLSGVLRKDPKALLGYDVNHDKGSLIKQAANAVGLKLDNADSARSQMYHLADEHRAQHGGGEGIPGLPHHAHMPSPYSDLRRSLDNEDDGGAREEIGKLTAGGRTLEKIGAALGLRPDGSVAPELFTGKAESEQTMLRGMTDQQKETWRQAQRDRTANARRFQRLAAEVQPPAGIPRLSPPAALPSTTAGQSR